MKTKSYKNTDLDKKWLLLDARDETLGRLSSKIASILMGKNKAQYTPHNDLGDYVCLLYTSPSPRDRTRSRMPSSA